MTTSVNWETRYGSKKNGSATASPASTSSPAGFHQRRGVTRAPPPAIRTGLPSRAHHLRRSEQPIGPHEQHPEDDRQRHEDREARADEADVVAGQRLGHPDDPASDHRALGG